MASELGQISFYLAKFDEEFDSIIKAKNLPVESETFQIRNFNVGENSARFYCIHNTRKKSDNPPWLTFINQQLNSRDSCINFDTYTRRPSGLLLLELKGHILAAAFGVGGIALLDKDKCLPDFGIKVAMNMCGNQEIRQTKSRTHAYTTKIIDRQLSKPSDAFSFGLGETEFLNYISAHLKSNSNVTLQGKDSITIKIIGDKKLTWDSLMDYGEKFIDEYTNDAYKKLFPNYPNLQSVSDQLTNQLDQLLIKELIEEDFDRIHLAIPEFVPDDEYSYTYTNHQKMDNTILTHVDIHDLKSECNIAIENLTVELLKRRFVYAYSPEFAKVLEYKKWKLYDCIVAEISLDGNYFILSGGVWKKVDDEFSQLVNDFINDVLIEETIPARYHNIDIWHNEREQCREEIFNQTYCEVNGDAILFDQAGLRISTGPANKEFCDILEFKEGELVQIIHVKKYGGSSSINYLFSQARFYCESFISDETFLREIRDFIKDSMNPRKDAFLSYINSNQADLNGSDYEVKLWLLYDKNKTPPQKSDLPLMAKYELKMTYERLRNTLKYKKVSISMIPVKCRKYKKVVKGSNA